MLLQKVTEYFDAFSKADLSRVGSLLSNDVCLRDWTVDANGIESVLSEISNIFSSLSHIQIKIVKLYESNSTVIAELIIFAKEIEPINVVDIISFNRDEKIYSIRAYKG